MYLENILGTLKASRQSLHYILREALYKMKFKKLIKIKWVSIKKESKPWMTNKHLFIDFFLVVQVILFEIDCAIFYTNFHELFCQFIKWTKFGNSGKSMDNCWMSCQVMDDMKKVYDDLAIINL